MSGMIRAAMRLDCSFSGCGIQARVKSELYVAADRADAHHCIAICNSTFLHWLMSIPCTASTDTCAAMSLLLLY